MGHRREQPGHLFLAQHDRQSLGLLAVGQVLDHPFLLQRHAIEEPQGTDCVVEPAPGVLLASPTRIVLPGILPQRTQRSQRGQTTSTSLPSRCPRWSLWLRFVVHGTSFSRNAVCHCLEQAVQRPTRHRERRCLSHGHNRAPQSSRSPSLLLADVRVLFVNHGRIGTACSGMAHRSGRRGSDRSRHTQSTARPTRKPMALPHRTDLGKRPCPCSFRACAALLVPSSGTGFGSSPAEQWAPARPKCSRFRRNGEKRMRNGTSPFSYAAEGLMATFKTSRSLCRHQRCKVGSSSSFASTWTPFS